MTTCNVCRRPLGGPAYACCGAPREGYCCPYCCACGHPGNNRALGNMAQIPEDHRQTIVRAIRARYPDAMERAAQGHWDGLLGCYFFHPYGDNERARAPGILLGVEKDGHIHS